MIEKIFESGSEQRVDGLACPLGGLCLGATEGCGGPVEQFVAMDIVHAPFGTLETGAMVPRCGLQDIESDT